MQNTKMMKIALALSLTVNAAAVAYAAQTGGMRRLFVKMDLAELPRAREPFQQDLEDRYRKLPNTRAEIVFAGDSLVGDGPWAEFYGEIHNRGIGGETTADLLCRIDEVTESRPRKIFLLLGANDMSKKVPLAQTLRNYRKLLEKIRADSPSTDLFVIGMLPVNTTAERKAEVREGNAQLEKLVGEFPGVRFVDLTSYLADGDGLLRREFTADGLHMKLEGYLAIREPLGKLVTEPDPTTKAKADP